MLLDRLSWLVFVGSVALAPVFFGGNVPLGWSLTALLAGFAMVLQASARAVNGESLAVPLTRVAVPLALFTPVLILILLQILPLVPDSWKHPIWHEAADVLDSPFAGTITLSRSATLEAFWITLTVAVAYWLGLQHGRSAARAKMLVEAIAVFAAINAVYGLFETVSGHHHVLWFDNVVFKDRASGTFINPNHFAALLSIGFACGLTSLISAVQSGGAWQRYNGSQRIAALMLAIINAGARHGMLLILIVAGVAASGSRAGYAFLLVAAVIVLLILFLRGRGQSRKISAIAGVVVIAVLLAGVLMAGDNLDRRLAGVGTDDSVATRLHTNGYGLRIVADSPWFGFGFGAFEQVFPMYRDGDLPWFQTLNAMHNSYLEAAIGLGIPGAVLLIFACGWVVVRCARGAIVRRRDAIAPIAATAAMTVIALHALVDFSIQLQGIAYVLAALAGVGTAQTWSSRDIGRNGRPRRPSSGQRT
jgi:O-antigen ligase